MKQYISILFAVLLSAVAVLTSCQKPEPEATEFETSYSKTLVTYIDTNNGISSYDVVLTNAGADARYGRMTFSLYGSEVDIQNLSVANGTYEVSAIHDCNTASKGMVTDNKSGDKYSITGGTVEVKYGKIGGVVTLENGHTLTFNATDRIDVVSKNPLPDFTVEVKNNSFVDLEILIKPTDRAMEYIYVVLPEDRFAGKSDSTIQKEIQDYYQNLIDMGMTEQGTVTVTNEDTGNLEPVTNYCIYIYGLNLGKPSTGLYTFRFTTTDQNNPFDVSFAVAVTNITKNGAFVEVTPSDRTVLYVWDVVKKSVLNSYGGKVEGAFINDWLSNQIGSYWPTIQDVVKGCGMRGTQSYEYTTLSSETNYVVFAVCVNANGVATSSAYVSPVFTTEASKQADVVVYQENVAYYDGDELYAADSDRYAKYAGMYYVHNKITVDKGEPVYGYAGYIKDDPNNYSDEELTSALVRGGVKCELAEKTDVWFLVAKNGSMTEMNTITVGEDANGDFGPVDKYTMYLFPNGCKPISEVINK